MRIRRVWGCAGGGCWWLVVGVGRTLVSGAVMVGFGVMERACLGYGGDFVAEPLLEADV